MALPTAKSYTGPGANMQQNVGYRQSIAGTDKWNEQIERIATAEGINPVLVKAIMTIESKGDPAPPDSPYGAVGLMGLVERNYPDFDYNRMKNDSEYAIWAGCQVLKQKIEASKVTDNIHEIAWRYKGKTAASKSYADQVVAVYKGLGLDPKESASIAAAGESGVVAAVNPKVKRAVYSSLPPDDVPAHRFPDNPFALRIGDCQFFIPPTNIATSKVTMVDSQHTVRSSDPTMTKSGFTNQQLVLTMYADGQEHINGFKTDGPTRKYHMDGLRPLIAQFYKTPFLPIKNELINDRLNIYNVALKSLAFTTVPEFPNLLKITLTLMECTITPFTNLPDMAYDDMFMYPLFRMWYQKLMQEGRASSYLAPVPKNMDGSFHIRVLDEDKIADLEAKVAKKYNGEVKKHYALGLQSPKELDAMMMDWTDDWPVVTSVAVQMDKTLTPIQVDDFEVPSFQDLGGMDKLFVMQLHCKSRAQLQSMQNLTSYLEELARDQRFRFVSGFMEIQNELVNLAGIHHAMIMNIDTQTIEGYDNEYIVTLTCKAFDPGQKNQQKLNGFNYKSLPGWEAYGNVHQLVSKINQKKAIAFEHDMNQLLNTLELYPDLDLPSYDQLNKWIEKINTTLTDNRRKPLPVKSVKVPFGGIYADPDFYLNYQSEASVYRNLKVGDLGDKVMNLLRNGTMDEGANMKEQHTLKDGIDRLSGDFIANAWDTDLKWKRKLQASKPMNLSVPQQPNTVPAGLSWGPENPIPSNKELVRMSTYDMMRHDKRGRMVRAYPTYMLLFVDEGQWVDGRRIWNNYYLYHAIHQIDVVKDKDNPVDLAFIKLSNVYGTLDFDTSMHDPRGSHLQSLNPLERLGEIPKNFMFTMTQDILEEGTQLMEHAKLTEGARIHLRTGYGATPDELPVVFNGHIASISDGEEIDMVCQGDGVELINGVVSTDPKSATKNEPYNAIQEMLVRRENNYWFSASSEFEFFYNYQSYYGIEHFGFVESKARKGFFNGLVSNHAELIIDGIMDKVPFNVYDVMKNIYRGSDDPSTSDGNSGWHPFDGEKNINLSTYNKTPWDIGTSLSQFVPEFIFATHPHGFRSTLFFGMPHWPVKYGYIKTGGEGNAYSDYREMYKPYQQFHMFVTGRDIIHNNIKASSEHLKHIVTGVYKLGDGQEAAQSYTVYADRSIVRDQQKMMVVDTGVWQDLFGPDFLYKGIGKYVIKPIAEIPADVYSTVGELVGMIPLGAADRAQTDLAGISKAFSDSWDEDATFTPGQVQARTVAIGAMQRKFMEMYQGELVIFGDPSVKPWDIFYLNDTHLYMNGTAQVGRVSTSLSRASGYVSVIKPDLLVSRTDGKGQRAPFVNALIAMGSAATIVAARKIAGARIFTNMASKSKEKGKKAYDKLPDKVKGVTDKATDKLGFARKGLKLLKSTVVLTIAAGAVSEWLETWYEKETKYNNMIFIYPLWKMGNPFVAGIKGAQHIIPGYVPKGFSPVEERVTDPEETKKVVSPVEYKTRIGTAFSERFNGKQIHKGVDLLPMGLDAKGKSVQTNVVAVADGEIISSGFSAEFGNFAMLRFKSKGEWYVAMYMHMADKGLVRSRKTVKAGQRLGVMGNTGRTHAAGDEALLHFELCKGKSRRPGLGSTGWGDNRIDPVEFLKKEGVSLT